MDQSEKLTFGLFLAHRRKRSSSASKFTIVHMAREGEPQALGRSSWLPAVVRKAFADPVFSRM